MNTIAALKLKARLMLWARFRANRYPSVYFSHSQFGEDMVARAIFGDRREGTYVDLGAHHPVYYSNTHHFYCKGWRGLNVDALPGSMDAFRVLRPRDANVEACVAATGGAVVPYFMFEQAALNTLDPDTAERRQREQGAKLLETRGLPCTTLARLIEEHLQGRPIDLLSVDVEGLDESILRSYDWQRYRPTVLIFERHQLDLAEAPRDPLVAYLASLGFVLEAKCGPSFIMKDAGRARPPG